MKISLVAFGLGFTIAGLMTPVLGIAAGQDSAVQWATPDDATMTRLYPVKARAKGVDGNVVLDCIATIEGGLRACTVKSEHPADLNFGGAALVLARELVVKPEIRNGKPVEVKVEIPIHFTGPGTHVGSMIAGSANQVGVPTMLGRVPFTQTPTYADVAAVYPAKNKAKNLSGKGTMRCVVGAEGKISSCSVQSEVPAGSDFGNAALKLADKFRAPARGPAGKDTQHDFIIISVVFPEGMGDGSALFISKPVWETTPQGQAFAAAFGPKAQAAGLTEGHAVLTCTISATGALTDCGVKSETPAGAGFGDAALQVSRSFQMRPWTPEGQAMVGRKINLPLGYKIDVKDAAASPRASAPAQQ
jgi:TonB family protein